MKTCGVCKKDLPAEAFGSSNRSKDGLRWDCKECRRKSDKRYREVNKDKSKAYWEANKERFKPRRHEYYIKNKEEIIRKTTDCIVRNRERVRLYSRKIRLKLKREVFTHYCGGDIRCKNCPETNIHILSIDHIDGDGSKHRKELGKEKAGGCNFYRWLRKNNYPDGFQVLCMSCQYRKRRQEMAPSNPTEEQQRKSDKVRELKIECLKHYGSVCPCGETDLVLLTLDHVNDDGAKHRRETNARGFGFYFHLKQRGFPNDTPLQVLCINCQFRKRAKNEQDIADKNLDAVRTKAYNRGHHVQESSDRP